MDPPSTPPSTSSPSIPFFPITSSPPSSPPSPPLLRPMSFSHRTTLTPLPAIGAHAELEHLPQIPHAQEQNLSSVSQEFKEQQKKYMEEQQQREQQYIEQQHTRRQRKNTLQLTASRNKITPGENPMLRMSTGSQGSNEDAYNERPPSRSSSPTPTTSSSSLTQQSLDRTRSNHLREERPPSAPRKNSYTGLERPRNRSYSEHHTSTPVTPITPRGMSAESNLSESGESKKDSSSSLDKLLGGKARLMARLKKSFSTPERREQWAWCVYDFGKSAFESVLSVFIGPYITYLAQKQACMTNSTGCFWCEEAQACLTDIPPTTNSTLYDNYCYADSCFVTKDTCCNDGGDYVNLAGTYIAYAAFFSFVTSASVIFQVILLPFLGAIGDIYNPKKFWIGGTVISATALISILGTNSPNLYWVAGLLYIIANVCFGTANIFYNASLLYVAPPEERDNISSRGFAIGYTGSVLFLGLCLAIFITNPGMSTVMLLVALTGVWWFCWALIPFIFVTSKTPRSSNVTVVTNNIKHNDKLDSSVFYRATFKLAASFKVLSKQAPQTALFLIAAAIYNDGIMTIGGQAAVFATETVNAGTMELMIVLLILNITAALGAVTFNLLAKKIKSTKVAIFIGIVLYWVIVIYAYFLKEVWEVWVLGALMGIAMGSTQSLSRSFLAVIIPKGYESEIFSFYEVTQQGTSWIGPLVYGAFTTAYKNNQRPAMLSMLIFLVIGGVVLLFVNVDKAKEQAAKCTSPHTTEGEEGGFNSVVENIDVELDKSYS